MATCKSHLARLAVGVGLFLCQVHVATAAFEQSVQCLANGAAAPSIESFNPARQAVTVNADAASRFVAFAMQWSSGGTGMLASNGFGMEFKSYHYNYDDAAATGKGPAYVRGPGGYVYCDLPGCYLDSDFLSSTNSAGEYSEPQVAFGFEPGAAAAVQTSRGYIAWTRALAGRGNKSLLKVRNYATKRVMAGIGSFGYFLCRDIPAYVVFGFQDGVYSPTCVVRSSTTGPATTCPLPPPAVVCESPFALTGNEGGANLVKEFGSVNGPINLEFETFGVPDALTISQEPAGTVLLNTGMVSGYNPKTVQFNAAAGTKLRIKVDGNQVQPTAWDLRVSCPGQALANKLPRRSVHFYVRDNTCSAQWTIRVDGGPSVLIPQRTTLSIGAQHFVQASWTLPQGYTCGGTSQTSPGSLYVNDGSGEVGLIGGYGPAYTAYFDVR